MFGQIIFTVLIWYYYLSAGQCLWSICLSSDWNIYQIDWNIPCSGGPTSSKEDYLNDYYNDYPSEYDYEDEDGDSENSKETIVTRNIKFLTQSKKITINEGDTIKLPCTVDNMDHLVIFWKKGEKIISMGNQILNTKDKR